MRTDTTQGLHVLRSAHAFASATDVTPEMGPVKKHVEQFGAVIDSLTAHAVEQDVSERAFRALAQRAQLQMEAVRLRYMRPVERLGKALFPDDVALHQSLTPPESHAYEQVIIGAQAMAARAVEHRDRFVAAGFHEDFAERLKAAALALKQTVDEKAVQYGRRSAATAAIKEEFAQARELLRLLDSLIAPQLRETPGRLAEWRTLSRFAHSSRAGEDVEAPVVAPVVAPAASQATEPMGREDAA